MTHTYLYLTLAVLCVLPMCLLVFQPQWLAKGVWFGALLLAVFFATSSKAPSELKYVVFGGAVVLALPVALTLLVDRWLIRWMVLAGMLLPVVVFDATAVNFFSFEAYKGTSRGMEISVVYLVAILLLGVFFLLKGKIPLAPEWGSRLYLLYFLLCLPSLAKADNPLFSWFELWKMMMVYLVFLAVYAYLEYSHGDFDVFLLGAGILAAVNFFLLVRQHLQWRYQLSGFFPHQNSMAMFMSFGGALLLSCYVNSLGEEGRRRRWWFLLGCCLASFAVFRAFSRGAVGCYPIGLLMTSGVSLFFAFSPRKVGLLALLAVIGAVGMLYMAPKLFERFATANPVSWETRVAFKNTAMRWIREEPLCGVGLNNWSTHGSSLPVSERKRNNDWNGGGIVETIYLLVAAECGLPCFFALLLWFGYYLWVCLRLMARLRNSQYFYLPAGLLGGLVSVYLQSALEWVLKQQINFIWLMIFFAMLSYLDTHWVELVAKERAVRDDVGEDAPAVSEAMV